MPRAYSNDRRDRNEGRIILKMQALYPRSVIIKMRPGQGCDLIWTTDEFSEHVEIKNPAESWQLTQQEQELKDRLEAIGRKLWIVETEMDIKSMFEILSA
jgi:hypothetical protein